MNLNRRSFFLAGAAALLPRTAAAAKDAANRANEMIILSPQPLDREMPLSGFADTITPVEHFFVRSHAHIPQVKLEGLKLQLDGLVDRPATLSMSGWW